MPNVIDAALDCLARDVSRDTIEACAALAETRFKKGTGYFTDGYNEAVRDIAADIRSLKNA